MIRRPFFVIILLATFAALFAFALQKNEFSGFKPADDFPRGALIYVQFRDLPALIEMWRGSKLREKYLAGKNFEDFQNRHLALKLAARAEEISKALGVSIDLDLLGSFAETSVAIAVYDIGRTEFVLVAPMSEEKLLASQIYALKESFTEFDAGGGLTAYKTEFRVDNERETQQLLFAAFRGRLIVSTTERHFRRTIENIRGGASGNRLARESDFAKLAAVREPGFTTVWLNQAALNKDYYFRKYWAMSDVSKLEKIRAGRFDFDAADDGLTEKRVFLTTEQSPKLAPRDFERLARFEPKDAAYSDIRAVTANEDPISGLFFDRGTPQNAPESTRQFSFYDWEKSEGYIYLDNDYSEDITDETGEITRTFTPETNSIDETLQTAEPRGILTVRSPLTLPAPYLFDDRKAVALVFAKPQKLSAAKIESAISTAVQSELSVEKRTDALIWDDFGLPDGIARRLKIPWLGRSFFYYFHNDVLFFSNSADLLTAMTLAASEAPSIKSDRLTVVDLKKSRETFGSVFAAIEKEQNNGANLTLNIGSLMDSISETQKIEIRERSEGEFLFEEVAIGR